jgi:hypothetical protein
VLCSWESPFADCLSGAPSCDYLSRAIVPCRGAPITDTAYMGLTSCRWITITGMVAHPRRGAQSASSRLPCRCRTRRRALHPHLRWAADRQARRLEHLRRFAAVGGDASVDHLRDRFRLAVLGARPRRSRRSTEAAPQRAAASGLAVFPGRERPRHGRSRGRIEQEVRLGPKYLSTTSTCP